MKVLVINSNRSKHPVVVMPLGPCMVAEAAERAGHEVQLLDLMFERRPLAAVEHALKEAEPDVVGISVRNIDNTHSPGSPHFLNDVVAIVKTVRSHGTVTVVLGGGAISIMPEEYLRASGADVAVFRNGEYVFPALLDAVSKGTLTGLPGTAWIENGVFKRNDECSPDIFTGCPFPDYRRWLDTDVYRTRLATVPVQTKRGCPFKCIYCTCPLHEGADYRLRAPQSVTETVKYLVMRGERDIEFVDNVFNSPYVHALAVCEELARSGVKARFETLELNPKYVDERLLGAMERSGFVGVGVTAESVADTVLQGLGKQYTSADVVRAAESVRRHRIPCLWMFMLGGPGETKETVRATMDFAGRYVRPGDVAFFNIGIRIYPGTELERLARREGLLTAGREEMFNPVTYFSPDLDPDWLSAALEQLLDRQFNFACSDSIALSILPSMFRLGYGIGLRPPVWQHTRFFRKAMRLFEPSLRRKVPRHVFAQ